MTKTRLGGEKAGETWTQIIAVLDNGREVTAWVSNARPGYFKEVFVPFDFEHEAIKT